MVDVAYFIIGRDYKARLQSLLPIACPVEEMLLLEQ